MKSNFYKKIIAIATGFSILFPVIASAQATNNLWNLLGGKVSPVILNWVISTKYSSSTEYASFKTASTTNLSFGGILGDQWADFCVAITGSADLCDGNDASGAGGSGNVSTSTGETAGNLAYWTSTNATPATLGKVGTTTLTATAPLSLSQAISVIGSSASALTCTTASSGVGGCLSNTAFDTFNNKQAAISVTWPITLAGAAVGFDGISTSSAPTTGNLSYWTGVNKLGTVATSSKTCTAPLSCTGFDVVGGGSGAITIAVSGDWTGTIDGNNFDGGAIGVGDLLYGSSAGSLSELSIGTGGYVLGVVSGLPGWVATSSMPLVGDVTGTLSATVVGNDSHDHTASTISGLGVADFTSANISQWTNDSGYLTQLKVGTSSVPTIGQIPYWTGNGTPSTLGSVATGTITCTGSASCSTAGLSVIGGNLTITGSATGGSGVGTVSTSTSPTIGQLSYWTSKDAWPETQGSVGTTTLTATAPLALDNPVAKVGGSNSVLTCTTAASGVAGCLSNTAFDTFNNKADLSSAMTGTFDGVDFGNGTLAQNAIWVGGAAAIPSELSLGTAGYILASSGGTLSYIATTTIPLGGDVTGTLSATVVGNDSHDHTASTISGLGVSDFSSANISQWTNDSGYKTFAWPFTANTNYNSTSTTIGFLNGLFSTASSTFSNNLFFSSLSQGFLYTGSNGIVKTIASTSAGFLLDTGDTGTGVYDFGGATSFEIPNAASPTVDASGEIAVDGTSGQLIYYNGAKKVLVQDRFPVFGVSTTTTWTATTTQFLGPAGLAQTWNTVRCETDAGFIGVSIYDGTNRMNYFEASSTIGTITLSTNNTFTAGESRRVDFGTTTTATTKAITCTADYSVTAD